MSDPLDWASRPEPLGARPAPIIDMATQYPDPVGTPNPLARRRHLSAGLIAALAVTAMAVFIGLGTGAYLLLDRGGNTFDGHMTLTVPGCASPGYEDVATGGQVTVTDTHGTVVAAAALDIIGTCYWQATFPDVPAGEKFYGIAIGHRGTFQVTEQQLRDGAALSIG